MVFRLDDVNALCVNHVLIDIEHTGRASWLQEQCRQKSIEVDDPGPRGLGFRGSIGIVFPPLFDPTIVHIVADTFSLAGIELQRVHGRLSESAQVCKMLMQS